MKLLDVLAPTLSLSGMAVVVWAPHFLILGGAMVVGAAALTLYQFGSTRRRRQR